MLILGYPSFIPLFGAIESDFAYPVMPLTFLSACEFFAHPGMGDAHFHKGCAVGFEVMLFIKVDGIVAGIELYFPIAYVSQNTLAML